MRYSVVFILLLLLSRHDNYAQNAFFIPNKGQVKNQDNKPNNDVLYTLVTPNYNVNFYADHFSYELFIPHKNGVKINRVEVWPKNASSKASILPSKKRDITHSFYQPNIECSNIHEFEKLTYENIWEGVDIEFLIVNQKLKYNYIVSPKAHNKIALEIKGALPQIEGQDILFIDQTKTLMTENFPSCYWEGEEQNLLSNLSITSQNSLVKIDFPYHREKNLIIDPIAYSEQTTSYYGGIHQDFAEDIVKNSNNEIILTGYSLSLNNIATTGAHQQFIDNVDSYIAKFDSSGNRIWATYFGGNDFERSYSIAIDNNDNIILSGNTMSISGIATTGAFQSTIQSGDDNFIAKFTNNGTLTWSTYFGGNNHDFISSISTDYQNNIYFTGHTASSNYPLTPDAHYSTFSNSEVAYFTALSHTGQLLHSSFIGNGEGKGNAIEIKNNSIYITGATRANNNISFFNSYQNSISGDWDGFLIKLSKDTFLPLFGTYFGGTLEDKFNNMVISEGNIYLAGYTNSTSGISDMNSYQQTKYSYEDGMLIAFDTLGNKLWGTYFGGNGTDYLNDLSITNGNIWMIGASTSTDIPTDSSAFQQQTNGGYDIILTKFTTNGNYLWSSYKGGASDDYANSIIVNSSSSFFYCGNTGSNNNFSTNNAHQVYYGGNAFDGFLSKICKPRYPSYLSELADTIRFCMGDSIEINSVNNFNNYLWNDGSTSSNITIKESGNYFLQTIDSYGCPGRSDTLTVVVHLDTVLTNYTTNFICDNDSVLLTTQSEYINYTWNNNSNLDSIYVHQTGDYWCSVMDENGCSFDSDTVTIQSSVQEYSINVLGSPIICSGSEVILYINSSGLSNYSWNNNLQTPSVNINSPGDYWLTGTNIEGCPINSDTITVIVSNFQNQNVSLNLSDSINICEGDNILVSVNEQFVSYEWQSGDNGDTYNATQEGLVYVSVVDTNGCTSRSDSISIQFYDLKEIHVNYNGTLNICEGDSLYCYTDDSLTQITWYNGLQNQDNWVNDSIIFYTAYDTNNCLLNSDTITINTYPSFTPLINVIENQYFCNNAPILLLADSDSSTWNNNTSNDTLVITNNGAFYYTLLDTTGCSWKSDTINIELISPMNANIIIEQENLCLGESVRLKQSEGHNFISIRWNDSINSTNFDWTLDSTQTIYLELEDIHNCIIQDSIYIVSEKCYASTLIYPNPTKDFLNIETATPIQQYSIFDNLGSKVKKALLLDKNKFTIDVQHLSNGIYYLKLISLDNEQLYKFEKQ